MAAQIGWLTLSMGLVGAAGPTPATAAGAVEVTAQIDGRAFSDGTETDPIRLDPKRDSVLSVEVTNRGSQPITVRIVRLEGRVVGLSFFAYDTAVGLTVPPNSQGSRRFTLDLGGLDGQATGLVPGSVKLLDNDRRELASQGGVVDVRGSLRSVYGLFGVGVAALTVVSLLGCITGLARHRLHPNRWRRAMRFLTPGLGLGLFLNFTLSATRVFVPAVGRWLTIVVVCSAASFALGYLTPAPDLRTEEEMEEDEEERLALRSGATPMPVGPGPVVVEIQRAGADGELSAAPAPLGQLGPSAPRELTAMAREPESPAAGDVRPDAATTAPPAQPAHATITAPGTVDTNPPRSAAETEVPMSQPANATVAAPVAVAPRAPTTIRLDDPDVPLGPADDEAHQPTTVVRIVADSDEDPGEPPKAPTTIVTEQ